MNFTEKDNGRQNVQEENWKQQLKTGTVNTPANTYMGIVSCMKMLFMPMLIFWSSKILAKWSHWHISKSSIIFQAFMNAQTSSLKRMKWELCFPELKKFISVLVCMTSTGVSEAWILVKKKKKLSLVYRFSLFSLWVCLKAAHTLKSHKKKKNTTW